MHIPMVFCEFTYILKFEDIIKLRIGKVRYITETAFFLIVSMTF